MTDRDGQALIRRIRPDEVEVYREFRLRALADAPDAFGDSYALAVARPPEFWRERVAQMSAGDVSVLALAVDASTDTWLGMTGGYVEDPTDGSALVVSVWVAPEARRRQLARRLVEAIVEWAREKEIGRLRLWVTESNVSARRLYEGAGFMRSGEVQPLPSNPTLQEIEMVRDV